MNQIEGGVVVCFGSNGKRTDIVLSVALFSFIHPTVCYSDTCYLFLGLALLGFGYYSLMHEARISALHLAHI